MIDDGDGDDETRAIIIMRSLSHRYIYGSIDKRRQIVCIYICVLMMIIIILSSYPKGPFQGQKIIRNDKKFSFYDGRNTSPKSFILF